MENFALIFVAITIGYLIAKKEIFPKDTPLILNQFILYISAPALVLLKIPQLSFSFEVVIPVVIAWAVMSLSAFVTFYISKILSFSREITGSLMLVAVLGNTSYLGIPIIQAYFGENALGYVMMYDQMGTFIALCTYGTFVSIYYSDTQEVNIKAIVLKIVSFPPFIALIIALFFMGRGFSPMLQSVLSSLANTIIPLALVAVGLQLKFKLQKEYIKPFSIALFIKLIFAPVVAVTINFLFGWNSQAATISIMEASMAPMITAAAVASMAGLSPVLSSAIVGYGILISFLTTFIVYTVIT